MSPVIPSPPTTSSVVNSLSSSSINNNNGRCDHLLPSFNGGLAAGAGSSSQQQRCQPTGMYAPPHVSTDILFAVLVTSGIAFTLIFYGSWMWFQKYWEVHFAPMSKPLKADTVARVGSSLHSIIVVPILLYYLFATKFNENSFEPEDIPENVLPYTLVQISFAITCGYFTIDAFLTYGYKMPLWQAFLAHHIFAATPYMTFMFVLPCAVGTYILAGFMVVETTNITLNTQVLLERSGRSDMWLYPASLYTTCVLWLITRVYGPLKMVYTIHAHTLPSLPPETQKCLYFNVGCAYFIVIFCLYGFFGVLLKEVYLRWKSNSELGKVAHLDDDTRMLKASPSMDLSADDVAISGNSPTHVSLYAARKEFNKFEHKIEDVIDKCLNRNQQHHHDSSSSGGHQSRGLSGREEIYSSTSGVMMNSSSSTNSSGLKTGDDDDYDEEINDDIDDERARLTFSPGSPESLIHKKQQQHLRENSLELMGSRKMSSLTSSPVDASFEMRKRVGGEKKED